MPSPSNCLPVYGPDRELLYHAPIASVSRLIEAGRVRPLGTRTRIRALIALGGDLPQGGSRRPPVGQRYSHKRETDDNPQGVWTFSKLYTGRSLDAHKQILWRLVA